MGRTIRSINRKIGRRCAVGRIVRKTVRIRQTIATITAEDRFIAVAEREILLRRGELEAYLRSDPRFGCSLEPCAVRRGAPEIARRMAEAAARVGVGPMAAVAGAIAGSGGAETCPMWSASAFPGIASPRHEPWKSCAPASWAARG